MNTLSTEIIKRAAADQILIQASGAKKWYYWASHSGLVPMIAAAKTIKRHRDGKKPDK